jgi:polysaccharide export outer membrane protein
MMRFLSHCLSRRVLLVGAWVAWIVASPWPCVAQQRPSADSTGSTVPIGEPQYVIGPEDVLDIAVWKNDAISRTVPVRPDGKISLPLLNDVQAAGYTPMQLRDIIVKALAAYIATPEVSVIVREVRSFKVAVIGEVKTPGRYELKSGATVLDVLAMAGGLTEYAERGRIVILRRDGATTRRVPFDYGKVMTRNDETNGGHDNFLVRPGDIILVP